MIKKTGDGRPGNPLQSPRPIAVPETKLADVAASGPFTAQESAEPTSPRIVGVGASAGGLDAFTDLLGYLPVDTGFAYVLIQHLDPDHESHLPVLLSRATRMPVAEVQEGTLVEANHVYVISPRSNLAVSDGVLSTLPRPGSGRNLPIDAFFQSLAADQGSEALGVLLSGTGSDGTVGLRAIRMAGGTTFAQERQSAKFDSMPGNAIAAGAVDFELPTAGIARRLAAFARCAEDVGLPEPATEPGGETELRKIFRVLRSSTGVDFGEYKHSTLYRRIKRRMVLRGFTTLEDYIRELEHSHVEANELCEDCFITVTAFFREPAIIEQLKASVLPALIEERTNGSPIRIWVPGCSTGEEAYSMAICVVEFLEEQGSTLPIEIFATDISEAAIEKARAGIYSEAALAHVTAKRIARYFTRLEHGYQIAKSIRDMCVFARHDVSQDPPFSKLDLISCCNVLIYLGPHYSARCCRFCGTLSRRPASWCSVLQRA